MRKVATIDYETFPIEKRPNHPPIPVGVSINIEGRDSQYLSWGHPEGNNCSKSEAARKLKQIYKDYEILFHYGKFDLEVGEVHFGLPLVPPNGWHDSMLLAFLYNPREDDLELKKLAFRWLGMKNTEQSKLRDWIKNNVFTSSPSGKGQVVIARKRPTGFNKVPDSKLDYFIAYAPAGLAGKYAIGDTTRTYKLYKKFYAYVKKMGMLKQYDIELRTVIKAIEMEREGINIDSKTLAPDLVKAKRIFKRAENAVQKKLGDINLNSPKQKIEAFERANLVKKWELTDKGNPKTSIDSLMRVCTDAELVKNLDTYSKYNKLIGTYMQPWLDSALENDGKFFPWFNTIKGDDDRGTYTGRFSSNFQQVPRKPEDKKLPFLRNYVIADKKTHLLFNRDFSGQELRILAHFEDGQFLSEFLRNPKMKPHKYVQSVMEQLSGVEQNYNHVKNCNFLIVYGGGVPALARKSNISIETAQEIFDIHAEAMPGIGDLKDDLRQMARLGEMFKTAGGRYYDFEDGKEYVALNTLIQGSAADHSKRALLNIDDMIKAKYSGDARIMLTVHDEFMNSAPRKLKVKFMKDFREAMELDELFDLPMLTDGKVGECWGKMESVDW